MKELNNKIKNELDNVNYIAYDTLCKVKKQEDMINEVDKCNNDIDTKLDFSKNISQDLSWYKKLFLIIPSFLFKKKNKVIPTKENNSIKDITISINESLNKQNETLDKINTNIDKNLISIKKSNKNILNY